MRPDLKAIFAERLSQELKARGLSHNQLAKVSGVGQRSISRIIKGEQDPTLGTVQAIADTLGMPVVLFLTANVPTGKPDKTVRYLRNPYPPIIPESPITEKKSHVAKRRRE